ncbi:Fic family protein [Promicromonospora sp. AC04]|uniref:Fic family protein n=1 Tax=Promicromonospora sp. AC04 TaxID=2135723 RepID=UPI000D35C5EC|nr:Fic family protein [Promicromonospora sp. AC04]PUB30014.1 Fic family protein [Promicromonospora sp. AC04]
MRSFVDLDALIGRVPFDVVSDLRIIDTGRGSEALYRDKLPALLTSLAQRARVASIEASSAIEGIVVESRERADVILSGEPVTLRDRSEKELAGYRAALDYLYQEDWRPLNMGLVLHLHRLLFSFTDVPGGGFKTSENVVVDRLPDGTQVKRFTPVSAAKTPQFVEELVWRYSAAMREDRHHPVLLVGLFVLDLLTIHPFLDGNGRITRALTNALLEDSGYEVTRYVSLESSIAASADEYYDALQGSTAGWHDGNHEPWHWLRYFVRVVRGAYDEFQRATEVARAAGSKKERVQLYVLDHAPASFRMADIRASLPGVSDATIRNALEALRADGFVEVDGTGRNAAWNRISSRR